MKFNALVCTVALAVFSLPANAVTCAQSMLTEKTWNTMFVGNQIPYFCPFTISPQGNMTVNTSQCYNPPAPAYPLPAGTTITGVLMIDRACKVTGTVTVNALPSFFQNIYTVIAWRIEHRVTGALLETGSGGRTYPFEMIEGN